MTIELTELSVPQLKDLNNKITQELVKRSEDAKKAMVKQVQQFIEQEGIDLRSLFKDFHEPKQTKIGSSTGKQPLIYFNPLDSTQGWSGKGRKPAWAITWLENGGALEDLKQKR